MAENEKKYDTGNLKKNIWNRIHIDLHIHILLETHDETRPAIH